MAAPISLKMMDGGIAIAVEKCGKRRKQMNDLCVLCGRETIYGRDVPVTSREHYVEGVGQLCPDCYKKVYGEEEIK